MSSRSYVVGWDGSHRAGDALAFAAYLARATQARLLLVSILSDRDHAGEGGRQAHDEAMRSLEAARASLHDIETGTRVLRAMSPARGLQRIAAAEDAGLIAVGATRRPDQVPGVHGVGERLVRSAHCPVAVVPAGWSTRGARRNPVACAFDGGLSASGALHVAHSLALELELPLRVIGVAEPLRDATLADASAARRAAMRDAIDAAVARCEPRLDAEGIVCEGAPAEILADMSAEAELLVTGVRPYGFPAPHATLSISGHLVRHAACPVLVVPLGARTPLTAGRPRASAPGAGDSGLLSPAQTSLLTDQYELTMAASYLRRRMDEPAVFELFARHLPGDRRWLLVAGLGPALSLVRDMRFGADELAYLEREGFGAELLGYLETFRFTGDVEAMPEGTVAFANEPIVRVTAPRIEAQLLETLLLNQINFQTAIATKAARLALAAGAGDAAGGARIVDFSPRRDHGVDAAMKAARCAAIAGAAGTSCVAAAMRYGLRPVGTMAHSYVLSFPSEEEAFGAFLEDNPSRAVLLVDTFDTGDGVRAAIRASRATGVPLQGVRLDSGDLLALSREARRILDDAGMREAIVLASGDLEERQIARLVAAGAPIDTYGVGTDLGTSRDAPALGGVYKLVADRAAGGDWRPVAKRSPGKATLPWAKQVYRRLVDGEMVGDTVTRADEIAAGEPLLRPAMRAGLIVHDEPLSAIRERAAQSLNALPAGLRRLDDPAAGDYPIAFSALLTAPLGSAAESVAVS